MQTGPGRPPVSAISTDTEAAELDQSCDNALSNAHNLLSAVSGLANILFGPLAEKETKGAMPYRDGVVFKAIDKTRNVNSILSEAFDRITTLAQRLQ